MMAKLKFYPKKHVYYYGRKRLKSVTTFVGEYFKPFNAREIARKLSTFPNNKRLKHGVRWFLREWKGTAEHGTRVHQMIEAHIKFPDVTIVDEEARDVNKYTQGRAWLSKQEGHMKTELKVYDETLGLAGTIDLVITNNDGTVTLVDWKTSKTIHKKAYNKEIAKEPIEHLEDTNYNKYSLQLSTYAYMLEHKYKTPVKDLIMVHLLEDNFVEYKLPYLKEEVKKMLEVKNE